YLVLLHGFLSSRAQWAANLGRLSEFCRPVTVELLGHGRSASPSDPAAYSPTAYVDSLEQIRAEIGADRWFLCGQSFGAGLTLRYALTHPERVIGQAFTNSVSGLAPPVIDAERRDAMLKLLRSDQPLTELRYHPIHGKRLHPVAKAAMIEDADLLNRRGLEMSTRHTIPHLSVRDRVGETAVPTLLINGTWEKAFQPVAAFATEAIRGLQVVELEGGHSINAEAVDGFDAAIGAFITGLTP
ncbi:MAG: alpha/beta fold hydrolase, partial [Pseudomonadota bacterium]